MKKLLITIMIITSCLTLLCDEKKNDYSQLYQLLDIWKESNNNQIKASKDTLKMLYIAKGKMTESGTISQWSIDYYKSMSKAQDNIIQESEYYNDTIDMFKKQFNIMNKKDKEAFYTLMANLSAKNTEAIFHLKATIENLKKDKKTRPYLEQHKDMFIIIAGLVTIYNFQKLNLNNMKKYSESVQNGKKYNDKTEEKYGARYDMEQYLKNIKEGFYDYFFNTKVPMYNKIEKLLDIK